MNPQNVASITAEPKAAHPTKTIYRIDQLGSFLRPPELLAARTDFQAGKLSADKLRALEDKAVLDLLQMQKDVGIGIYSDGEVRRDTWFSGFAEAADGLGMVEGTSRATTVWHDVDGNEVMPPPNAKSIGAVGKLTLRRRFTGIESDFLREHAPGAYKVTLPSPLVLTGFLYHPGASPAYPTAQSMLEDITGLVKAELKALSDEGTPYIQMDEGFTRMVARNWREQVVARGGDPEKEIADAIRVENECYAVIPRDRITVGMHICRGNSRSRWVHSGGYDALAEQVFSDLNVDRYLLEYDSERAGTFEPLRFVPKNKIVVLGLISTKFPQLEDESQLLRRIEEATKYISIEQLALSPQCGFASVKEGNLITPDDQRRKLELVVKIASRVWTG